MTENEIFTRALNIGAGWEVDHVEFKQEEKELQIYIRTVKESVHPCGTCGKESCRVYDHGKERKWRHINFFGYSQFSMGSVKL